MRLGVSSGLTTSNKDATSNTMSFNNSRTGPLSQRGRTPLLLAADCGQLNVLEVLLKNGANQAATTSEEDFRWTALHLAALKGREKIVVALLEAGAEKDCQDRGGQTALMWAAVNGHVEVVRLLLDAGAEKDCQDRDGFTALSYAAEIRHVAMVQLLLNAGADKDLQSQSGWTALMRAAGEGRVEMVQLLLDAGYTALLWAAGNGHVEIVQLLLDAGADKARNLVEVGPLCCGQLGTATWKWHVSCWTPAPTRNCKKKLVRVLTSMLRSCPPFSVMREVRYTALMGAADNGHVEMVQLLLDAGANKEMKDTIGLTALLCAAGNGHVAVAQLLLDAGADKAQGWMV
ncbi:unnamed protein product [Durusdinium trenchii]|uniref:Uncharacterized protein n=1 Tax=Durusdinium trenchii TaxID=1381693 RepID=A0ABP0SWE8_9DINO